jgi:hypothetical protein
MQPIVTPGSNVQASEASSIRSAKQRWKSLTFKERIEIQLASTIAICTLIMVGFGYWQASVSNDAVKIAADALRFQRESDSLNDIQQQRANDNSFALANRSIAIAESSVATAKGASRTQERYAKIETRAYLCIDEVFDFAIRPGSQPAMKITILNIGKTPAYDCKFTFASKTGTGVYKTDIDKMLLDKVKGSGIIGAGQKFTISPGVNADTYSTNDSTVVFTGKYNLYIFGEFHYRDKFNEPHFTRFCLGYDPRTKGFYQYERYNEAD